jgi:hypothetical protein
VTFPPTHPVTRLDRVVQQLRSFADMHASELEALALEIEDSASESAQRARTVARLQADEAQLVVDELVDIRTELAGEAAVSVPGPDGEDITVVGDPAVDSPKRARWIAEQAARDAQLRRPRSRRQLLGGVPHPPASAPPSAPSAAPPSAPPATPPET